MQLYMGIDGGGTGCRAVLADENGHVLGRGQSGPANIYTDITSSCANILEASRQACNAAGVSNMAGISVALGLAGARLGSAVTQLRPMLPFSDAVIVNDGITAALGALHDHDGIVAAIGTGSVFVIQRNSRLQEFGGHGFALGDHGGGAVLGRALLTEALLAADGFAPLTPLLSEVLMGLGGMEGVIAFSMTARPADYAAYAPHVVHGKDPVAERLFGNAVQCVHDIIAKLQDGARYPVVFLGGLGPCYAARLQSQWEIRSPLGGALDGALWLAHRGT